MSKIRTLIVEDEHLARERVQELTALHDDIVFVGEATTGPDAVAAIEKLRPDLVLLDISLPAMNGFEVLACIDVTPLPLVIFMTAHDEYAVRAFEVHAVHYLLKPIEQEHLDEALRRVRRLLAAHSARADRAVRTIAAQEAGRSPRLIARSGDRVILLRPAEVDWIEAVGNYAKIHRGVERIVVRQTLSSLEEKLREHGFVRIQRSVLVNGERIAEIRREGREQYSVILSTGSRFRLSMRYRANLGPILDEE